MLNKRSQTQESAYYFYVNFKNRLFQELTYSDRSQENGEIDWKVM